VREVAVNFQKGNVGFIPARTSDMSCHLKIPYTQRWRSETAYRRIEPQYEEHKKEVTTRIAGCSAARFGRLGNFRKEHSCVLGVLVEIGAKFLGQERFFTAGFDIEREPDDQQADEAAHLTDL
jgi:hypothetical protein